jgi:Kef-type K+ transport system membrane component KefB/nucleotide-binding universal stress UspA family protein
MLFSVVQFSLPLKNEVLIFLLLLIIILFAPLILNRLRIPHLIGLIIAGSLIGPHGFNLLLRDSSITLFGSVGLLYIMFLAGLEIDMADFRKNSRKSFVFGMYTFIIPMLVGTMVGLYILHFSMITSVLLASMFASHTLIAYPIVSKLGVIKNRAVNITVGGTLITDTLALLVLAVIVGMTKGEVNQLFWIRLGISVLLFGAVVMFIFPIIGRWFFKRFDDHVSQYIFVLAMVFLGAFLAQVAGIEAIVGAFLSGLSLNKLIPRTSPLMNRVVFAGNALFIPFFLIGVGMLVDYRVFFQDAATIKVAITMTIVATFVKFAAAWLTQKTHGFSADERRLIFGLSNAQAAATLAAVLVGYNIILGKTPAGLPVRLFDDTVLNGTIVMILITCTIASLVTQRGAQNIALQEAEEQEVEEDGMEERILISINNQEATDELMNLSTTIKSKSNTTRLFALHVIDSDKTGEQADKKGKAILEQAARLASATDMHVNTLLRYDVNTLNGIANVAREQKITDIILGLHSRKNLADSYLGNLTEGIIQKCDTTTLIYKPLQPLATIKRHLIIVPDKAEREIGFPFWLIKVWNISRNTGSKLIFYSTVSTLSYIREITQKHPVECEFQPFSDWEDFLILSRELKRDDNLIVILSRKDRLSYQSAMPKIPGYLDKYFEQNSFILIYPVQTGMGDLNTDLMNTNVLESFERLDDIGKTIARLFRWK